ncbi:MAG: hypothetical protein JO323_21960 [Acidobacteriia bacterium]|nr:hypothetical protein [Terriglobia bacterium]
MPYCSQCGNQVGAGDAFCGKCGARQPLEAGPYVDPLSRFTPRTASICCYIPGIGWVASIIVLASPRFRRDRALRFHAFQGLYLFVAWLLDDWVVRPWWQPMAHFPLGGIIRLVLLVMSVFMMVKAAHRETYHLPLFGELAQRSLSEE